jgi:hypothetical protein
MSMHYPETYDSAIPECVLPTAEDLTHLDNTSESDSARPLLTCGMYYEFVRSFDLTLCHSACVDEQWRENCPG